MAKSADAVVLFTEKVFQLEIEDIAQGREVEEMFTKFFGNYFPAVFAHLPLDMRIHIFSAFFK